MIQHLVRKNIQELKPYASARDEFKGEASVFLDANENSLGSPSAVAYNRYPDPLQWGIKKRLAAIKNVRPEQIFLGNGSDEAIDVLFRVFCEPGVDNAIILPPTYGMYAVQGSIHGTELRRVPLDASFQPNVDAILAAADERTKLLFLCSPNNPTGNLLQYRAIERLLAEFRGIVVVDEAYIDFADEPSWSQQLDHYPTLVVLQTLSKAWGLAGLRVGMAMANETTIGYFNKVKYPYNIGSATIAIVEQALGQTSLFSSFVQKLKTDKKILEKEVAALGFVECVFPSDANFILAKMRDAQAVYDYLAQNGVIVRNRSKEYNCGNCLRITVGTTTENERLVALLKEFINP
jgi:histidinol-phosphate aminotransferase